MNARELTCYSELVQYLCGGTSITTTTTHSSERIAVVDVLRAFALFGIIINHATTGFLAGPAPNPLFNVFGALDDAVIKLAEILTFGKFFAIFSFLFGLSFAIQMQNAERKNAHFSGRFAWRLVILFAIGLAHSLFFSGDILTTYALLGLLLIPFRKRTNKTLIITALILILNIPGLLLGVAQTLAPPPTPEQQQAQAQMKQQFTQQAQQQFEIKQAGTLRELMSVNITQGTLNRLFFQVFTGRLWVTFGLFLLGLYAGRLHLFRETDATRNIFRRVFVWGGITAGVSTIIMILYPTRIAFGEPPNLLSVFASSVQQASLAAFFVAVVTLLFWKRPQGWLAELAPTGKMGLTTYLMQSVFGLVAFYGIGFGLLGQLGAASYVGLGILFFAGQILFARWWLRYFTIGPVEWLWRSLTHFKVQPALRIERPVGLTSE
jgi:uncharacterized protein